MARIKCKNCGKVYRYETEGCCPECGAYNRPPRHEKVNADGTIYHMKNNDYMEVPQKQAKTHSGKVCFEEKECHEEKECYEEKVCYEEKAHSEKAAFTIAPMLNQIKQSNTKKNNNPTGVIIAVVCFMLAAAIGSIVESCSGPRYDYDPVSYEEPYIKQYTVNEDVATVYLGDASSVCNGVLCYYTKDDEYHNADMDTCKIYDDSCVMTFYVGEDYQYAECINVAYGDTGTSLWIDSELTD